MPPARVMSQRNASKARARQIEALEVESRGDAKKWRFDHFLGNAIDITIILVLSYAHEDSFGHCRAQCACS